MYRQLATRSKFLQPLPQITEIEENTMWIWLKQGTVKVTDVGQENVYFVDEFGLEFYCKCYPLGSFSM
jgi:hypothetical protein